MRGAVGIGILSLLWSAAASAQDDAAPGSRPLVRVQTTTTATSAIDLLTETASVGVGPGEAWEQYHDAFIAMVRGDTPRGKEILNRLIERFPEHPATEFAVEILAKLHGAAPPPAPPPRKHPPPIADDVPTDPFAPEKPSNLARAELAVYQTLFGITGGALLCAGLECSDASLIVGLVGLGGAAGLTVSLVGTDGGITPGRAQTLNAATGWGIFNGAMISAAGGFNGDAAAGFVLASQLVGLGTGFVITQYRDPRGGDVSRTTSLGAWSGLLTVFVHGALGFEADQDVLWGSVVALSDIGLVVGGVLGGLDIAPMTRGRVLLIDAGGIVGALLGVGIPVLIANEIPDNGVFFGSAIVGTVAGLGLATYLTRNWDGPDVLDLTVGVFPTPSGGGTVVMGARF